MEDQTNIIILILGILTTLIGLFIFIYKMKIIMKNILITGEIYDRRSSGNDHYLPVIKYTTDNYEKEYISSYYSILQKIGNKIKLVYSKKNKMVIGTLGELLYKPIVITLVGLFITIVMTLFFLQ